MRRNSNEFHNTLLYRKRKSISNASSSIKKKDGNKDKWIGVGGHFEEGESPEDCL